MTKFDMPTKPLSEQVNEDVSTMLEKLNEMMAQPDGTVPASDVIALFRDKYSKE